VVYERSERERAVIDRLSRHLRHNGNAIGDLLWFLVIAFVFAIATAMVRRSLSSALALYLERLIDNTVGL
jgi:hypothetical protein